MRPGNMKRGDNIFDKKWKEKNKKLEKQRLHHVKPTVDAQPSKAVVPVRSEKQLSK